MPIHRLRGLRRLRRQIESDKDRQTSSPISNLYNRRNLRMPIFLRTKLPGFDCVDGSNEHEDFQQQAIVNPDNQYQFQSQEQNHRAAQAQSLSNQESGNAAENVTEGVDYCIPIVTKRSRSRAVAFNDEVCIF